MNYKKYIIIILFVCVVLLGLLSIYLYTKNNTSQLKQNATEVAALSRTVGRLVILPDEIPTVATVSDPVLLKGQSFFVDAKKGDKVLIYSIAQKAILYDPVVNKIVNMAPLNTGSTVTPSSSSTSATNTTTPIVKKK